MFRRVVKDHVHAREIDKKDNLKNCWNAKWLDEKVQLSKVTAKGKKTVSVSIGDSFNKIDVPGKALCKKCGDVVSYGSNGKKAFINHFNRDKHLSRVRHESENFALGSMGAKLSDSFDL